MTPLPDDKMNMAGKQANTFLLSSSVLDVPQLFLKTQILEKAILYKYIHLIQKDLSPRTYQNLSE